VCFSPPVPAAPVSKAEGKVSKAEGKGSKAEGKGSKAEGKVSKAEGKVSKAEGKGSKAEGKVPRVFVTPGSQQELKTKELKTNRLMKERWFDGLK